jgi:hypothetical protein
MFACLVRKSGKYFGSVRGATDASVVVWTEGTMPEVEADATRAFLRREGDLA